MRGRPKKTKEIEMDDPFGPIEIEIEEKIEEVPVEIPKIEEDEIQEFSIKNPLEEEIKELENLYSLMKKYDINGLSKLEVVLSVKKRELETSTI